MLNGLSRIKSIIIIIIIIAWRLMENVIFLEKFQRIVLAITILVIVPYVTCVDIFLESSFVENTCVEQ